MKKYEYLERTYFNRDLNLIQTLNDMGDYGWQIVSLTPYMMLDNPQMVWRYEVIFMKEVSP